ncbi:MAG: patatin-like phospholipase family protein [Gemmobacter sp.]
MAKTATKPAGPLDGLGQITLVFQGGGALGAYQAGVYEALHERGIEPDWIIGTSIGAINAAIIAGNAPEDRLDKLKAFWARVRHPSPVTALSSLPFLGSTFAAMNAITSGIPGFFTPNAMAFLGPKMPLGPDDAGYYSTEPLAHTLADLVDPALFAHQAPRLTVGAANVSSGEMRYFDSAKETLSLRHVMASGALPPAFPAVRIDGELYWDGGILSNTPVEAVFDDNPRRSGIVFAVHLWRRQGEEPRSIWDVANREKDLQYASRAVSHIKRQRQIHRLRHVISQLLDKLPQDAMLDNETRALAAYGCRTQMHVVRLLAPRLKNEDHTKDVDFSPRSIDTRWQAGLADMRAALAEQPWRGQHDPHEGFVLHDMSKFADATEVEE